MGMEVQWTVVLERDLTLCPSWEENKKHVLMECLSIGLGVVRLSWTNHDKLEAYRRNQLIVKFYLSIWPSHIRFIRVTSSHDNEKKNERKKIAHLCQR
jgi:hypothetical protein